MTDTANYCVIGLMSGTSLDGLDIACCDFTKQGNGNYAYRIIHATTIPYPQEWKIRLSTIETKSAFDYVKTDADLGKYFGQQVGGFIEQHGISPHLIASHGHTIFHQPHLGFSAQIGNGNAISAQTGIPVVYDFRSFDVAMGGQGAPLVPIGDQLLFSDYDFCLNLGGISNISYNKNGKRIAYDISLCNIPLNYLAQQMGEEYDKDGQAARSGNIDESLLSRMNHQPYFSEKGPKSLGKEWFTDVFQPMLIQSALPVKDKLRTMVEHIAQKITQDIEPLPKGKILITGGGAFNCFLIERMKELSLHELYIPDKILINYKEALIFAFLGFLRANRQINTLAAVTGAPNDSCSGCLTGFPASLMQK